MLKKNPLESPHTFQKTINTTLFQSSSFPASSFLFFYCQLWRICVFVCVASGHIHFALLPTENQQFIFCSPSCFWLQQCVTCSQKLMLKTFPWLSERLNSYLKIQYFRNLTHIKYLQSGFLSFDVFSFSVFSHFIKDRIVPPQAHVWNECDMPGIYFIYTLLKGNCNHFLYFE